MVSCCISCPLEKSYCTYIEIHSLYIYLKCLKSLSFPLQLFLSPRSSFFFFSFQFGVMSWFYSYRPYTHWIPQKGILRKERVLSPNSSVGVLLQDKFDKFVWLGGCGGGILFSPKPSTIWFCKKVNGFTNRGKAPMIIIKTTTK